MSWNEALAPQTGPAYTGEGKMLAMPSLEQRLNIAVNRAEEQLRVAKEAREIFQRNPDLERLLDLMQRGHF